MVDAKKRGAARGDSLQQSFVDGHVHRRVVRAGVEPLPCFIWGVGFHLMEWSRSWKTIAAFFDCSLHPLWQNVKSRMRKRHASAVCSIAAIAAALASFSASVAVENPAQVRIASPTLTANQPSMPPPPTVTPAVSPRSTAATPSAAHVAAQAGGEKADITFRFENQPVSDVLKLYSDLTGRTVIQNAGLGGMVTISVQTPLTRTEAILALESVLFANGVALTPMGDKFVKAAASGAVAREGVPLAGEDEALLEADRITSQIISLRYLDAADPSLLQSLSQFIHQPGGTLMPLTRSNSLLVIDTTLIVKRLQEILAKLDQPVENRVQTRYYRLENAEASAVASTLQALISGIEPQPATPSARARAAVRPARPTAATPATPEDSVVVGKVTIHSDDRTNTLIVMSRPSNFEFLDEIIHALDRPMEPPIQFKAFKLQHSKAEDVAEIILVLTGGEYTPTIQREGSTRTPATRRLGGTSYGGRRLGEPTQLRPPQITLAPTTPRAPTAPATPGQDGGGQEEISFVLSDRARIIPDSRQGSILALGTAHDLELVERIVPEIDLALAQVLIESVVVEVSLNNQTDFGINLIQRAFTEGGITGAGASTPLGTATNLFADPKTLTDPTKFGELGLSRGLTYFASFNKIDLDAVVQALASAANFKVLQTPIIQSSQNEKAHIFVGETRPIVTATQTGFTSGDSTIPVRSSIEQFDIGITLDIIPNITPGGLVELEVAQAVEDVTGSVTIDGNEQPIVARRELDSTVSVRDQGVIVLGGLIRNNRVKVENKVPIVGDLPIFGHLFKQTSWRQQRTELVVLIRPTVLRNVDAAQEEAQKLRDRFKGLDYIPKDKLPPLPKAPEPPREKPWYAPFQPPKDES